MKSYNEWEEEEIEENEPTKWPINNYVYNIDNKRTNYSSKYNISSSTKNFGTSKKELKKDYNYNYSYSSQNEETHNSTKYLSQNNKYLTLFNLRTKRYEPSNATVSEDGVIRGYTDNCCFYISGSSDLSDLRPKPTILNKYKSKNDKKNEKNNNYNYNYNKYSSQNRTGRQNKVYESRTQVINPSDYIKKEDKKDIASKYNQKNQNKYHKNNYKSKTNINTRIYTINTTNDNKNYEKRNYHNIISPKKMTQKNNNLNTNYSRKSYYETEPNNNLRNYNNRNVYSDNIKKPLIPFKHLANKEPKATIQNINTTDNKNRRKVYKTSTNTNLEEKNKNNYYQSIVEKKPHQSQKRNNTPNISSRLKNKNTYTSIHHTSERRTDPGKNSIPNRSNYKSVIPYNEGYKNKNNMDINENTLNKTDRNYQPKYTLQRKNSNSNISNINKSRYNFPQRPKLREYGTKTEVHSFSTNKYSRAFLNNNGTEKEKLYGILYKKEKDKDTNQKKDSKKIKPKNRYPPRSFSIAPATRAGKKYGAQTESIAINRNRNYSRSNEYEVTDIDSYRKKQQQKENYSLNKNIPNNIKAVTQQNEIINNKKEYTSFERSLKNIKDNGKKVEKEKEKSYLNNKGKYDNTSTIFISNLSKDKKMYRTSTQKQAFRPHGYTLASLNEYEVPAPVKKYQNYGNVDTNKNKNEYNDKKSNNRYKNININRNNYFNAMKNLEEEIEVDDDNEQVEYLPPKTLTKIESKPKENKYSYNINKSSQMKPENKYNYSIKNAQKEDKTKYIKDNKNNKERTPIVNTKINNITKNTDSNKQAKNNYSSINTSKNDKENINKSKEQKQYRQYIPQNIQQKPIIVSKKKENLNIQPQKQIQQNIQIQRKNQQQNITQKEQKIKVEEQKEIQIKPQKEVEKQQPQKQKLEEVHQIEEYIQERDNKIQENDNENEEDNEEENENIEEFAQKGDNNSTKKSKYSSYFGDFNNNYYEIKGVSATEENNNEEEENENQNTQKNYIQEMQPVRNITFDIHSENLMVPAEQQDDKEEKEADEQLIEEDEQNDINNENENVKENEQMDDENFGEEHENYQENENEEGEMVGDEMEINEEENGNEEYDENEYEGEEIEDNVIEENNINEEEENNENE